MIINEISTKPCYVEIYCNGILISKATGFQIHHGHKYLIDNSVVCLHRNKNGIHNGLLHITESPGAG